MSEEEKKKSQQDLNICCLEVMHLKYKDTQGLNSKGAKRNTK